MIETALFIAVCAATIWGAARLARTRSNAKDFAAVVIPSIANA